MDELNCLSASRIADLIKTGEVSSKEVVSACLERIHQVNAKLNAVVALDADRAIEKAKKADQQRRQSITLGPLHGVPVTIKDSIDTKDLITTWGTAGRKNFKPEKDATVVRRLKNAGAIVVGKTNTPELTLGIEMTNAVYGPTYNPHDLSKSPGGSSGGAAAILAAGGSALDLGSDTGGSIREPAHYCGISGIKPTFGRVPRTGHAGPWEVNVWDQLTQIGPMARFVEDLHLTLPIIFGEDKIDPTTSNRALQSTQYEQLKKLNIAYYIDADVIEPDESIKYAILSAVHCLDDLGAKLTKAYPQALKFVSRLYTRYTYSYLEPFIKKTLQIYGTKTPGTHLGSLLKARQQRNKKYDKTIDTDLHDYKLQMTGFMEDYDLIICPSNVSNAVSHSSQPGKYDHNTWFNLYAYNLTGWPAAVIPLGQSSQGLPVAIQIVGRPWREDQVLAVANTLERTIGGFKPPDI